MKLLKVYLKFPVVVKGVYGDQLACLIKSVLKSVVLECGGDDTEFLAQYATGALPSEISFNSNEHRTTADCEVLVNDTTTAGDLKKIIQDRFKIEMKVSPDTIEIT